MMVRKSFEFLFIIGQILLNSQAEAGMLFDTMRPHAFKMEEQLNFHVGDTRVPYSLKTTEYAALPYCDGPEKKVDPDAEEKWFEGVSMWDRSLHESFFTYKVGINKTNVKACTRTLTASQYDDLEDKIETSEGYRLYVDNLAVAVKVRHPVSGELEEIGYSKLVPIGIKENGRHILYNHWIFTVLTQPIQNSSEVYIVGFEVEPRSYRHGQTIKMQWEHHEPLFIDELRSQGDEGQFSFTYSVQTISDSGTEWAHRMDHYLKYGNQRKHVLSLTIGFCIVFGLAAIFSCMLRRGIYSDFDIWVQGSIKKQQKR